MAKSNLAMRAGSCSPQNCASNAQCNIKTLVGIYKTTYSSILAETLNWINSFKNQPKKYAELVANGARYVGPVVWGKNTIVNANLFKINDPHQYHIATSLKGAMINSLLGSKIFSTSYTSFEDIYKDVNSLRIKGMGDLFIYDITLRIAYGKGIYPKKYVYIHRGSKIGLNKLLNRSCGKSKVLTTTIPSPVSQLSAMEIEDFLCVMKDCINVNKNGMTNNQNNSHP